MRWSRGEYGGSPYKWRGAKDGGARHNRGRGRCKHGGGCDDSRGGSENQGLTTHDRVEAVDGVSGVVNSSPRAVGVDDGVGAGDEVTVPLLRVSFVVSGERVLHIIAIGILGKRVHTGQGHRAEHAGGGGAYYADQ